MNVAHDERDGSFLASLAGGIEMAFESEDTKMSPPGGEVGLGDLLN